MIERITPSELVHMIAELDQNRPYSYVSDSTSTKFVISRIQKPEGPIWVKRFDPSAGEGPSNTKEVPISVQMLWRVANAFSPGRPINFDRILAGSYNTRSLLEALIAHTPQFYYCYPGRYEAISSIITEKHGHKHLVWYPDNPHEKGKMVETKTDNDKIISEIPLDEVTFDAISIPSLPQMTVEDANIKRRHSLIQIALVEVGKQLGFRTWVAENDRGIIYNQMRIAQMPTVVPALSTEKVISAYMDGIQVAKLIDCIWFRNRRFMPAVMEIEHSTGVTSGLERMKRFHDLIPPIMTRWVIVAADEDRTDVMRKAQSEMYKSMNVQYCPYSAVDELYSLCTRRHIKGVTDEFLDCYFEPTNN